MVGITPILHRESSRDPLLQTPRATIPMSTRKKNPVWRFFASVKLALFLLFILAGTSIIGTIVPQGEPASRYVELYPSMGKLILALDLDDMYNSWWFLSLLTVFSVNLLVCSLERIPGVLAILRKDNLAIDIDRLAKMRNRKKTVLAGDPESAAFRLERRLRKMGWKMDRRERSDEGGILLFGQRGGWSRFGVYVVHVSILIVLAGALVGSPTVARSILKNPSFAFKGSIMIPETRQSDKIFSFDTGNPIELGFTVRCDRFEIHYYDNGMPKEYLSHLTVLEDGKEVLHKRIEVNDPLTYRGITFYQSSYQPYHDFVVTVTKPEAKIGVQGIIPARQEIEWKEAGVSYGIINAEFMGEAVRRIKLWFTDHQGKATSLWMVPGREYALERPSGTYMVTAKQLYATGLQVTKDPGVWVVYLGCALILVGLYIAFFTSHKRLWCWISTVDGQTVALFAGTSHKNKLGFEKQFQKIVEQLVS